MEFSQEIIEKTIPGTNFDVVYYADDGQGTESHANNFSNKWKESQRTMDSD